MAWNNQGSLRGAAGAQLRYGNGAPTASNPSVQNDLDSYIDVQNGRLYAVRSNGSWPTTYASLIGPMGTSVRVGTGSPSSSNPATQNDGDIYIQTDAASGPVLWGPRSGGTWPSSSTSLTGAAGASFLSGSGAPSNSLGTAATPGYYDYTNFVIYGPKKADGTWPTGNSLVGPKGSQFYTDTAAPGLQLGTVGDFFFRSDTYDFFIKVTNAAAATTAQYPNGWLVMANLRGAAGTPGTNGVSPPGLYSGSGAPGTVSGAQVGSYYIRTDTTQLYGPLASNGTWGGPVNLIGSLPANLTGQSILITLPSSGAAQYPYWLKGPTGTSLFNVDTQGNIAGGNIYGQGTLQMIGAATMAGVSATTLSASGAVTLSSTLAVTGAATLSSTLSVSGNATLNSGLTVTGATSAAAITSSGTVTAKNLALTSGGGGTFTFADGTTQSTAATGSGSSGRGGTVQGMIWLPNNTASGTAYPFSTVISYVTGTAAQANIPLRKTMGAAGTIFGVSLSCPGSVSGGAMTFTLLKNGTSVWTQANAITGNTGATPSDTFPKPSSAISFAAGDVFTMTGTFATTGGQAVQAALEYNYTT